MLSFFSAAPLQKTFFGPEGRCPQGRRELPIFGHLSSHPPFFAIACIACARAVPRNTKGKGKKDYYSSSFVRAKPIWRTRLIITLGRAKKRDQDLGEQLCTSRKKGLEQYRQEQMCYLVTAAAIKRRERKREVLFFFFEMGNRSECCRCFSGHDPNIKTESVCCCCSARYGFSFML